MSSRSLCCLLRVSDEFHVMHALLELLQPLDDPLQPVRKYLDRVRLRSKCQLSGVVDALELRCAHLADAFLQKGSDLGVKTYTKLAVEGDVRVALRLDDALLGVHIFHCRRQNDGEGPSRCDRLVRYILRLHFRYSVKCDLDRRGRDFLHLRKEGVVREVAVQDVCSALALQIVGVA